MAAQELQPLYARSHDRTVRRQLDAAVVLDVTWRATCGSLTTDPDLDSGPRPAARS